MHEILSNAQMAEADCQTIEAGTPGFDLMKNAGKAVAEVILSFYFADAALVLCGPGNNGGDGFVIAKHLQEAGWNVRVACLVDVDSLKGDAAQAAALWEGDITGFDIEPNPDELVIDAVFGTGLSKPLEEPVISLFKALKDMGSPVVAVDIPSGMNGDTGAVDPATLKAVLTVTFHRKKLGHVLHPGAGGCGDIVVKDIGITHMPGYSAVENRPELWIDLFPFRHTDSHKYDYGHAVIYGAPELTGATRLAAESCARIGAGLVTVLAPDKTADVYRRSLPANILVRDDLDWEDERITSKLYGSGGLAVKPEVSDIPVVLDADALADLPSKLSENAVLTPHEGEFARAFPDIQGSKLEKAQKAAQESGAIIVLKGPDTVIAHPDGRAVINTHASADLATAGTGDVLAGLITGLLAQGMQPFDAACTAVWVHGECGLRFGPGLVASDLPDMIPEILEDLLGFREQLR